MNEPEQAPNKGILRLAKGAGMAGIGELVFKLTTPAIAAILTRSLGADRFGTLTIVYTVVQMCTMFSLLGLNHGVLRFVAYYRSRNDIHRTKGALLFSSALVGIVSAILATGLVLLAKPLSLGVYDNEEMIRPLQLFSIFIPILAVGLVLQASLQSLKLIKWQTVIAKLVQPVTEVALLLVFLIGGIDLVKAPLARGIAGVVALCLLVLILGWKTNLLSKDQGYELEITPILRFSTPLFLETMLLLALGSIDVLILGSLTDASTVGIFKVLLVVTNLITLPLLGFRTILAPMVADYDGREDHMAVSRVFKISARWTFLSSFPIFLMTVLFSQQLLSAFGSEFEISSVSLLIMSLGKLVDISVGSVGIVLRMTGHSKIGLFNSLLLIALSAVLDYTLIPRYGLVGAAIASSLAIVLMNVLRLFQVHSFLRMHPYSPGFAKPLASGVISFIPTYILSKLWDGQSIVEMLVLAVLFGVFYSAVLLILGLCEEDKAVLAEIRKNRLRKLRPSV